MGLVAVNGAINLQKHLEAAENNNVSLCVFGLLFHTEIQEEKFRRSIWSSSMINWSIVHLLIDADRLISFLSYRDQDQSITKWWSNGNSGFPHSFCLFQSVIAFHGLQTCKQLMFCSFFAGMIIIYLIVYCVTRPYITTPWLQIITRNTIIWTTLPNKL
jgi:hypothetical protein